VEPRTPMPADRRRTVAALVPVWNGAAFLADALGSILAQDPAVDEVVVIDDGSTDGSAAIARGFGPRVRCVTRTHAGLAATRNAAVREARSELVAFLDADDLWPHGRLALLLRALEENPACDIAQGRLQRLVQDGRSMRWALVDESWRAPNVATALIRRAAFATVGPFDESVAGADDVDWLLRAKERGLREVQVDAVTLHYRRHAGNMTNDVAADQSRLLRVLGRAVARRRAAAGEAQPEAKPDERS
jgi:glycosyltransferase involved in cell wall biosynthesis